MTNKTRNYIARFRRGYGAMAMNAIDEANLIEGG